MNDTESELQKIAWKLLDLLRGVGSSRGSSIAFELTFLAWELAANEEGRAHWNGFHEAQQDLVTSLEQRIIDSGQQSAFVSMVAPSHLYQATELLTQMVSLGHQDQLRSLAEMLFSLQLTSNGGREMAELASPTWLAQLLAGLVEPAEIVLDPVCGMGSTLLALGSHAKRIVGYDINDEAIRICQIRMTMAGHRAELHKSDSLVNASTMLAPVDAVVAVPPWGMSHDEDQLAGLRAAGLPYPLTTGRALRRGLHWASLAGRLLNPSGTAAVVLLESAATGSEDLKLLLDEGIVEAVIALPPGFLPSTSLRGHIWLLKPQVRRRHNEILIADTTSMAVTRDGHRPVELPADAIAKVYDMVQRHRAGEKLNVPGHFGKIVRLEELDIRRGLVPGAVLDDAPPAPVVLPRPSARLLSSLTLSGYKSFGAPAEVPLRPLTLIYGPNSSGKSTLVQTLLLLKQSIDTSQLVTQGPVTDVGSFSGVRSRHEAAEVEIGLRFGAPIWELPPGGTPDPTCHRDVCLRFADVGDGRGSLTAARIDAGPMHTEWKAAGDGTMRTSTNQLGDVFEQIAARGFVYGNNGISRHDTETSRREEDARRRKDGQMRARKLERLGIETVSVEWSGLLPSGRTRRLPRVFASDLEATTVQTQVERMAQLLSGIGTELKTILNGLVYLGPLRSAPQRFYSRTASGRLPGDGRDSVLYLYDNTSAVEQVNQWFSQLEVPYVMEIVPVLAGKASGLVGDLVAVTLTDRRSEVVVTPADVGYGISQVMPIVVELTTRSHSVICIEQPETHLHPRLQARLGDLLIHTTTVEDRANQVIVETHSEHMLLRLQRRIREGEIEVNDVCILYVDQTEAGQARVQQLRMDEDGEFVDEWPDGFFDERIDDLFGGSL